MGSTRTHRGHCCCPNQWMGPVSLGSIGPQRFLQMSMDLEGVCRQSHFSCDDRRLLRPTESQESKRSSSRPKELPRLPLDSRKESLSLGSRQKDLGYKRTDDILLDTLRPQDSPSHNRANSVIAKLMGLEEATNATGVLTADSCEPTRSPRPA
jgi:hypothetical protein